MVLRIAPLLFLLGCAANQSAFPVPPAFSPVEDAPVVVGQPGYVGEPEGVPRSPHKRVLPQTPETRRAPGIWAGDEPIPQPPMRKRGDPIPDMRILDIPVPYHPDARDGFDTAPTEQCSGAVMAVLMNGNGALAQRAMRLTVPQRACLAAIAHMDCLSDMKRSMDRLSGMDEMKAALAYALDSSVKWVSRTCPNSEPSQEVPAILRAMEKGNPRGGSAH